nr:MAG TPA: Methyl-coenzyme M reductase beta subunit, C-terminal domain [Caudoviricetes sp.]
MEIREDKTVSSDYKEYITGQKELFNGYATAYTFHGDKRR